MRKISPAIGIFALSLAGNALAQSVTTEAEFLFFGCAGTPDPNIRLGCYDNATQSALGASVPGGAGGLGLAQKNTRPGAWNVADSVDPISGYRTIEAKLIGDGPSGVSGYENALVFSCKDNRLDAHLTWAPNINGERWLCLDLTKCPGRVTTRIDDHPAQQSSWFLYYTAPSQAMRPPGSAGDFMESLRSAQTYAAQIDPSSAGNNVTVVYDLEGIEEVVSAVVSACGR